ncbi:kelch repeat-containing protein [Sorangium sp. So ce1024]|uniref:Kelch repeat-containing protein n=1 Tax=Sorangium sp. So ce1024 TaxID=3133327 RepID=UPI003F0A4EA1
MSDRRQEFVSLRGGERADGAGADQRREHGEQAGPFLDESRVALPVESGLLLREGGRAYSALVVLGERTTTHADIWVLDSATRRSSALFMRSVTLLPRVWTLCVLTLIAGLLPGVFGCVGEETVAPEVVLRRSFPEQAERVLRQKEAFVAIDQGFALVGGTEPGLRREIEVELPREGTGAIRLRGRGFEVRVREIGVEGAAMLAERAVAYRRAGGTSFWAAVPEGVEEWLHFEAGVAREGKVVAAWEVEGARVQQRGEAVELVDGAGWVRLQVTAPVAYAAGGREVRARMEGRGRRIELSVDAAGEAVLVDPVWSVTSSMTTGRHKHIAMLLGNGKVLVAGGQRGAVYLQSVELYDPVSDTWTTAEAMSTGRSRHTATLLGNGKVLVAGGRGGDGAGGALASAELYDLVTDTWRAVGSMSTARESHTATLLGNGKVLVSAGGSASAELYDPVTETWTTAGALSTARTWHTATLLSNGKVLVAGGEDGSDILASAELYDPRTDTWTTAGALTTRRELHTATLLGNGNVLVAGGGGAEASDSGTDYPVNAELYDPVSNTWSAAGTMTIGRGYHTATLLGSGKVLMAGGMGGAGYVSSAELYDPVSNTWSIAGTMTVDRGHHTATLLGSGKVLMTGGLSDADDLASAELYGAVDTTGTWAAAGSMSIGRSNHAATLLGNGKVLVVGSPGDPAPAELYDPVSNTWTTTTPVIAERSNPAATLLDSGKVLVCGGEGPSSMSAELYDSMLNTWMPVASMSGSRWRHAATLLWNGKVLVAGGEGNGLASWYLYDSVFNVWATVPSMSESRDESTATLLRNGHVLVVGGVGLMGGLMSSELYDPASNTSTFAASMTTGRCGHTATLLANGKVLVVGGFGVFSPPSTRPVSSAELYDLVTDTWTPAASMSGGRYGHTATLLANGKVLVVGGYDGADYLASAELYDPVSDMWVSARTVGRARSNHTATLLGNGKVLVAGGSGGAELLTSAELYTPVGSTCTADSDCASGFCADGVCCDTGCASGPCDACSIAAGAATDGICTLFTGPSCDDNNTCTRTDVCQSGRCTGTNPAPDGTPCPAGACATGICATVMAPNGTPCAAPSECESGFCADGVCCDTLCANLCSACTQAKKRGGTDGTCGPIQAGTDPDEECAPDLSPCGKTGLCDGAGACQKQPPGTVCIPASCDGSTLVNAGTCDGDGICLDRGTQDCGAYLCVAGTCPSRCESHAQCAASAYCGGNVCLPRKAEGAACGAPFECLSDTCIAGACRRDADKDGISDGDDNCPVDVNPLQTNTDGPPPSGDLLGDACDPDDDNDGILDSADNCPLSSNPDQDDANGDGVGDICDCNSPRKDNGTPCDDRDACTQVDTCVDGTCTGANPVECPQPPLSGCKLAACNRANGACILLPKFDGTPCPGGQCLAGGCLRIEPTGSFTAGTGGTAGEGGQAGAVAAGGSNSSNAGAGGAPAAGSPEPEPLRYRGNGCGMGHAGARGAPWLLLGLLLAARRRSAASRANFSWPAL